MIRGLRCIVLLFCLIVISPTSFAETEECSESDVLLFAKTAVDLGILFSGGCHTFLSARVSQECCDTTETIVSSPCSSQVFAKIEQLDFNSAFYTFLLHAMEKCRQEPSVGYVLTGCPDGVVAGEEQCDDGNAISGDGCSSYCFVEDGYDCFPDTNGTSICWQCEEECFLQHRDVCKSPDEPCGDCLEGFQENDLGYCAARKHVYYAAITEERLLDDMTCDTMFVGEVLEATPTRTSEVYIDAVRMWKQDRYVLGSSVSCFVDHVLENAPDGDDVVLVLELFVPTVFLDNMHVGKYSSAHVVLFSDVVADPHVSGELKRTFEVFPGSTFYLTNTTIRDCASYHGAAFVNFGVAVLEGVSVKNCGESSLTETLTTYECTGIIASSYGYLRLKDTSFINNYIRTIEESYKCVHYESTAFEILGHVDFENVTFSDTYTEGIFITAEFLADSSRINDIRFERVHSTHSLLQAQHSSLSIDGLLVVECIAAGGLIVASQKSRLTNFTIASNTLLDNYGIILNLGDTELVDGVIYGTADFSEGEGWGGAIVNRGDLYLERVSIESNNVGGLTSSNFVRMFSTVFSENKDSSQLYSAVYNTGEMEIDECIFENSSDAPTIVSGVPSILRNTIFPDGFSLWHVACGETVELPDGTLIWPCGFNANCTESVYSGVNCTCAPGHIGSPTVMCGPPAAVHVLPDTDVVGFVTKDDDVSMKTELLGLVSDGLGTVTWHIAEETLPFWLSVSPRSGYFVNDDPCLSELVDLFISFHAEDIRGNDTYHTGEVELRMETTYGDNLELGISEPDSVVLTLQMIVEVAASPRTSVASRLNHCEESGGDDGMCEVEAGSTVSVVVDLRDSSGYSLGVGGTGFGVDPAPLASIDYENGTHVVTFEAPQTHFNISVHTTGIDIQGSPITCHVYCSDGDVWDDVKYSCVKQKLVIPKAIVAIGFLVAFVCTLAFIFLVQRQNAAVQAPLLQKEAAVILSWLFVDIVDIGTDVGAYWSVNNTSSLSSYAPWYLAALCVAVVYSFFSLRYRIRALKTLLSNAGVKIVRSAHYIKPIPVANVNGMTQITDSFDLHVAIHQLQRKFRFRVLSAIGLLVEDLPMQILNTIMLCTSESDYPVEVLLSMEVTCILIGMKLSKLAEIRRIRENIRRIHVKARGRGLNMRASLLEGR